MPKNRTKTESQDRGRFSARRKTEAVLRLLRGEDLDTVSLELGVTAATLSGWRDAFLEGGIAAMKSRPADDRDEWAAPRKLVHLKWKSLGKLEPGRDP